MYFGMAVDYMQPPVLHAKMGATYIHTRIVRTCTYVVATLSMRDTAVAEHWFPADLFQQETRHPHYCTHSEAKKTVLWFLERRPPLSICIIYHLNIVPMEVGLSRWLFLPRLRVQRAFSTGI